MNKAFAFISFYVIALLIVVGAAYTGFVVNPEAVSSTKDSFISIAKSILMLLLLFLGLGAIHMHLKK